MAEPIEETLREIDAWYNELTGASERPKLLSKLALLEFCGWLETHLDALLERVGHHCGLDDTWVHDHILKPNYGFTYNDHLRPMIVRLVGEVGIKTVERSLEQAKPGKLEQLRVELGSLWKVRGHLAHSNIAAPVRQQLTINAPSWSRNRQRVIAKALDEFEKELMASLK
jgi:hypothetical protein